jgi:AcrR family transcriptional regulator
MPRLRPDPAALSRRERERLLRRQAMLAAARDVFAERGYVHATLDEVAERAEFGKGTLYNYFPGGKDELLRSVLDELFDELEELMEPLLDAQVTDTAALREALHAYLARSARYFYRNRALFHLMMREAWRLQLSVVEESRDYFHAQVERSVAALSEVVGRAIAAGAIRPLPARSFAHIILASVANHIAAQEVVGWPEDPATAAGEAAAFLTTLLMDGAAPGR